MGAQGVRALPAQEEKVCQIRKGKPQGWILPSAHLFHRPAQITPQSWKEPIRATEIRFFVLLQKTTAYQPCIMRCIISIKLSWFPLMPGRNFIKAIELLLLEDYSQWIIFFFILFNGKKGLSQALLWLVYRYLLCSGSGCGMSFTKQSHDTVSGYFKTKIQINESALVMF